MSKGGIMKKTKYTLPFVNKGKDFYLSKWTVRKHQEVLKETAKYEGKKEDGKLEGEELEKKYRNLLILKGLHEVDPNVTEDNLLDLHPDEKVALFAAVYLQGKRGILAEDKANFQKKKNPKPQELK